MNKIVLVGRLGQDPKVLSEKCVIFSIGTSGYNFEKKAKETDWHNITLVGKNASTKASMLKKGSLVAIEGRGTTNQKNEKSYYNIVTLDVELLDKKPKESNVDPASSRQPDPVPADDMDEDTPF